MRTLLLSLALCATAAIAGADGPPPNADDPVALLKALGSGLIKVENGPKDVARERALARKRGVPAGVETLIPSLRSEAENAAPYYLQLTKLLKEKPLSQDQKNAVSLVAVTAPPTAIARDAAAKVLSKRGDITQLVHAATDRPRCRFHRNWTLGHDLTFPEFSVMRDSARWLVVEADVLARQGRFEDAVKVQSRGLHLARHAVEEPIQIPSLVGAACQNITLVGMVNLLEHAERLPAEKRVKVHAQIRASLLKNRVKPDVMRTIRGETAWMGDEFRLIRRGGPNALTSAVGSASTPPAGGGFPQTARERAAWNKFMDASEARYLAAMRELTDIMALPRPSRVPKLKAWDNLGPSTKGDPTQLLRAIMQPMAEPIDTAASRTTAQVEAVLATIAVLEHRARTGKLPERLGDAPGALRPDPFSSGSLKYRREGEGFVIHSVGPSGAYDAPPNVKIGARETAVWFPRRSAPPSPK